MHELWRQGKTRLMQWRTVQWISGSWTMRSVEEETGQSIKTQNATVVHLYQFLNLGGESGAHFKWSIRTRCLNKNLTLILQEFTAISAIKEILTSPLPLYCSQKDSPPSPPPAMKMVMTAVVVVECTLPVEHSRWTRTWSGRASLVRVATRRSRPERHDPSPSHGRDSTGEHSCCHHIDLRHH